MRSPEYYLVIDVEATCADDNSIPRHETEIIEIGAVIVDSTTFDQLDEFQSFVRPIRNPRLTPFCIDLTTIRQIEVDIAPSYPVVIKKLEAWLKSYRSSLFCSWGDYDQVQIEKECRHHHINYPLGIRHLNLKNAFAHRYRLPKPVGMQTALRQSGLHLQGIHHRGIDDARNIARLLPYII